LARLGKLDNELDEQRDVALEERHILRHFNKHNDHPIDADKTMNFERSQ